MGKRIVIFGTGSVAKVFLDEVSEETEIVAFVNSNEKVKDFYGYKVIMPEQICEYDYDYIVIASGYYNEMEGKLLALGYDKKKIIGFIFDEIESYQEMAGAISAFLNKKYQRDIVKSFLKTDRLYPQIYASVIWKNNAFKKVEKDFVREQLVAYMAQEIERKKTEGAVAELGVFRGDFTMVINRAFPSRKLYLFDTFCGFDAKDVSDDVNIENKANEILKFHDTSEAFVLARLDYPEVVTVKKGWFPDTFDLEEERFCFVSIDLNIYDPVMSALKLFVPRMIAGGYILISTFNAPFYEGTRKAVIEFCDREKITFLPVPDLYGSVVICI